MIKKMIFVLAVWVVGGVAISVPVKASLSAYSFSNEEVSYAEKMEVCCKLDADRVLSLDTALRLMREGQLQITKVGSGIYRVVTPGGGTLIADLIGDNI